MIAKRKGTGLRDRLLDYLRNNQGEHLTIADAAAKFDCDQRNVSNVACLLRKAGELAPGPTLRLPG